MTFTPVDTVTSTRQFHPCLSLHWYV